MELQLTASSSDISLSDAGSCSTAAPERLGTDKSSGSIRWRGEREGGATFPLLYSPSATDNGFSSLEYAQLAPGSRSLLSDLHDRTEDVNAALDTVIRVLLHQQQRSRRAQSFVRAGRRGDTASQEGGGKSQHWHRRSSSSWDRHGGDWALPEKSICFFPAVVRASPGTATRRSVSAACGRAGLPGEGGLQTADRAGVEEAASASAQGQARKNSSYCWCCRRPFVSIQQQQVEHELERLQQTRLRERARAELQAVKQLADFHRLQQQNQQLEEKIKEKDDALRSAQAHIRALQQQLTEQRQLSCLFNDQKPAKVEILSTLVLSPRSRSLRLPCTAVAAEQPQQVDQTRQQQQREAKQQQEKEGRSALVDGREKIAEISPVIGLRDLTWASRRLADHALPADSTSRVALLQQRQHQLQQTQQQNELRKSREGKEQRGTVTVEPAEELPCCLTAVSLCIKSKREGITAADRKPDDLLAEDFKLRIQAMRKSATPEARIPAMKEWMDMFISAWRILQVQQCLDPIDVVKARMKSVMVPERPTEKSLRLVKERLEMEKTLIFKSLTQLQQESVRIMKQVFQTPWHVLELEKEKASQAILLSELRKEMQQLLERSTELANSLQECKEALAAAEQERDRLMAVSELCAVDVDTRFEQLQEKRHSLQESQAARAYAEAAAAASECKLRSHQEGLRGQQQQLLQKQQQLDDLAQQYHATKQSEEAAHQELHAKREESESLRMEIETLLTEREKLGDALLETQHQLARTTGALQIQEKKQLEKHQELLGQFAHLQQQLQPLKRLTLPTALRVGMPPLSQRVQQLLAHKYVLRRLRRCRERTGRAAANLLRAKRRVSDDVASAAGTALSCVAGSVGDEEVDRPISGGSSEWIPELQQQQQKLLWLKQLGGLGKLEKSWVSVLRSLPRVEKQLQCMYTAAAAISRPNAEESALYAADMEEIERILDYTCNRAAYLRDIIQGLHLPKEAAEAGDSHLQRSQQQQTDMQLLAGTWKQSKRERQPFKQQMKHAETADAILKNGAAHTEDKVVECTSPKAHKEAAAQTHRRIVAAGGRLSSMFDVQVSHFRRGRKNRSNTPYAEEAQPESAFIRAQRLGGVGDRLGVTEHGRVSSGIQRKRESGVRCAEEIPEAKRRQRASRRAKDPVESEESSSRHLAHEDVEENALFPPMNQVYIREEEIYGAYSPLFLRQASSDDCQRSNSRSRRRESHRYSNKTSSSNKYRDRRRISSRYARNHYSDGHSWRNRKTRRGQVSKDSHKEAWSATLSQKRRYNTSRNGERGNRWSSLQLYNCGSLCLSSSSSSTSTSNATTFQDMPATTDFQARGSRFEASSTDSHTEWPSATRSNRAGLQRVPHLRRAAARRFLSEPLHGNNRSMQRDCRRQQNRRYCIEKRDRYNSSSGCNSTEKEREGVTRFPGAGANPADTFSDTRRNTASQDVHLTGERLRRRFLSHDHRTSPCAGFTSDGGNHSHIRFQAAQLQGPEHVEKKKTRHHGAPSPWAAAALEQYLRLVMQRTAREKCSRKGGLTSSRIRKKRLHLLHTFYASQRRTCRANQYSPAKQQQPLQQQYHHHQQQYQQQQQQYQQQQQQQQCHQQQQQRYDEERQKQQAEQREHLQKGEDRMLQGRQSLQFLSAPSLAHEPALQHHGKGRQLRIEEKDTEEEEEEENEEEWNSELYERCNASTAPAGDYMEKQQHRVSLKALRKVEAELKQANNVVHQIESTLMLPAEVFQKMRTLTQQNLSLNSRLCLLHAQYRRVKQEKEELETLRVAEIDYMKFQEDMKQRIKQLEQQLRADAAAKTSAARKGTVAAHGQRPEKCQLENLHIQHTLEIRTIKDLAALDMERLRQAHEREVSQLQQALEAARQDMHAELKKRLHVSRLQQEATTEQLRCSWETKFQEMRQQHEQQLLQQKRMQEEALHRAEVAHEAAIMGEKKTFARKLQQTEKHWETRLLDQEVQIVKERDSLIARFRERLHRLEDELEQQRRESSRLSEKLQQQQLHGDRSAAELERQLREAMLEKTELQGEISKQGEEIDELRRQLFSHQRTRCANASANACMNDSSHPERLQADRSCQVNPPMRSRGTQVEETTLEYLQECADIAAEAAAAMKQETTKATRHGATVVAHATIQQKFSGESEATAVVDADTPTVRAIQRIQQEDVAVERLHDSAYAAGPPVPSAAGRERLATSGADKEIPTRHKRSIAVFEKATAERRENFDHQRRQSTRRNSLESQPQRRERRHHLANVAAGDAEMWAEQQHVVPPQGICFIGESQFLRAPSRISVSSTGEGRSELGELKDMHTEKEEEDEEEPQSVVRSSILLKGSDSATSSAEDRITSIRDNSANISFTPTGDSVEKVRYTPPPPTRKGNSRRQDTNAVSRCQETRKSNFEGGRGRGTEDTWQGKTGTPNQVLALGKRKEVKPAVISLCERADAAAVDDGRAADCIFGETAGVRDPLRNASSMRKRWTNSRGPPEESRRKTRGLDEEAQSDTTREEREDGQGTVVDDSKGSSAAAEGQGEETHSRELFRRLADVTCRARMPSHLLTQHKRYSAKESRSTSSSTDIPLRLRVISAKTLHERLEAANEAAESCASTKAARLRAAASGSVAATVASSLGAADAVYPDVRSTALEEDTASRSWRSRNCPEKSAVGDIPLAVEGNSRSSDGDILKSGCSIRNATRPGAVEAVAHTPSYRPLPAAQAGQKETSARDSQHRQISARALPAAAAREVGGKRNTVDVSRRRAPGQAEEGGTTLEAAKRVSAIAAAACTVASRTLAANNPQSRSMQVREPNISRAFSPTRARGMTYASGFINVKASTEKISETTDMFENISNPVRKIEEFPRTAVDADEARPNAVFSRVPSTSLTHQNGSSEAEETHGISLGKGVVMGISPSLDLQLKKLQARSRRFTLPDASRSAYADREFVATSEQPTAATVEGKGGRALATFTAGRAAARGKECGKVTADILAQAPCAVEAQAVGRLITGEAKAARDTTPAATSVTTRKGVCWDFPTSPAQRTLQVKVGSSSLYQKLQSLRRPGGGGEEDVLKQKVLSGYKTQQQVCRSSSLQQQTDKATAGAMAAMENRMHQNEKRDPVQADYFLRDSS